MLHSLLVVQTSPDPLMPPKNTVDVPDKDAPLRDDIRLLGRILGDTVREQEGEAAFEMVERIRQTSIRFHRDEEEAARQDLEATLNSLSREQTIQIVRAFSFFSHLANIAEDQHHIRRTRAHIRAASAPREGSMALALARASAAGLSGSQLQRFFTDCLVSPVLTAHPTEVRRRSTIDREMEVARLLAERDPSRATPEELAANSEALRRAVLTLWQTSILRRNRLAVSTKSTTDSPTTTTHSCASCRASTLTWKTSSVPSTWTGTSQSYPRSCALGPGSVVTATAILL
jgi:phosphoenolpyruvate carboxylase